MIKMQQTNKETNNTGNNKKKRIIKIIIYIAVVTVLTISTICGFIVTILGNTNYKTVAKKYLIADVNLDAREAAKYTAYDYEQRTLDATEILLSWQGKTLEEFYAATSEKYNKNVENIFDLLECENEIKRDDLKRKYGNYKILVSFSKSRKLDRNEMLKTIDDKNSKFLYDYMDFDKVKTSYIMEADVTYDGDQYSDTKKFEVLVGKYSGRYKIINSWEIKDWIQSILISKLHSIDIIVVLKNTGLLHLISETAFCLNILHYKVPTQKQ